MSKEAEEYFNNTISGDFFELMLGDKLGSGAGREVYEMDPMFGADCVVKFECVSRSFQNVHEWRIWNDFKSVRSVSRWLAPCVWISRTGSILVQRRTVPILGELPKKVPAWFTDVKRSNVGMLNGKPVVHDYGTASIAVDDSWVDAEWHE